MGLSDLATWSTGIRPTESGVLRGCEFVRLCLFVCLFVDLLACLLLCFAVALVCLVMFVFWRPSSSHRSLFVGYHLLLLLLLIVV